MRMKKLLKLDRCFKEFSPISDHQSSFTPRLCVTCHYLLKALSLKDSLIFTILNLHFVMFSASTINFTFKKKHILKLHIRKYI